MPPEFDLLSAPGHLIRRAQQMHTTIWGEVVGSRVTSVQFAILAALASTPELDQRALGGRIAVDPSTLGEICRRLVARGLVARERDARDARRYVLRLTEEGGRLLEEVTPAVDEVGRRLLRGMSRADGEALLRLLRRVVDSDGPQT